MGAPQSAQSRAAAPSPAHFFRSVNAYQQSGALKAAVELDVFSAIGEGARNPEALAVRCQASPRGLRILCDYLVIAGFLEKQEDQYSLTRDSAAFLDRRSPTYCGSAVGFLLSPFVTQRFQNLSEAVRKGGAVEQQASLEAEHPMWIEFARSMMPLMKMPADAIASLLRAESGERWNVLDIAAGHGIFGITLAARNPNATVTAVDWEGVLELASENARKAGVEARHRTIPGDAFAVDFGDGYDIALITNFLHHFDVATNERLLAKVRAALKPGGRAVTLDFIPNEDRVSPPETAVFSLTMLAGTAAGEAYTFAEYDRMFRNAGFASSELHALQGMPAQIIISRV